jgi:Protein of unknown function (DUF4435)
MAFTIEEEVKRLRNEAFLERKRMVVLVEGKNDEAFWSFVWDMYFKGQYRIHKQVNYPKSESSGKQTLRHFVNHTSNDLIICKDSDYDYLLENEDWKHDFIFQTYTYSFENYHCYAPSLKKVIEKAANTEGVDSIDFGQFLIEYSQIIYALLIQSLWEAHIRPNDVEHIEEGCGNSIHLKEHWKGENYVVILDELRNRISSKLKPNINPTDEFITNLHQLGLTTDTAYLFVRGKNMFNRVVVTLLNNLQEQIKNDTLKKIEKIENNNEKILKRRQYFEHLKNVKSCLWENYEFTDCFLFTKLLSDIQQAFN